ncbi:aldo/keto reductase [Planosporangium sp. 12N6]|uniref:aldo/keto reductase n=1 Tax=Planosporangium spinosum TaxID=3402278 RepID=UPI003CECCBAA
MDLKRVLGRSGIEVSALGVGTWAMGGEMVAGGQPLGWGPADDEESARALRRAVDLGVTLFDTADAYGAGHAEELLGRVLAPVRDEVVIATKWGNRYDERTRQLLGETGAPEYLRWAVRESLRRLDTDRIDVYQLHVNGLPLDEAADLVPVCEELVDRGLIRTYGWSTDNPAGVDVFAAGAHCSVVQHALNLFLDAPEILERCERYDLASLNRSPLAMGLLSEKVTAHTTFPPDTVRGRAPEWLTWFRDGRAAPEFLRRRDAVREILTSGGRTLAQGALAWNWARSPRAIPLPGCRTVAQVEENAGALSHGPLTPDQVTEIEALLGH